VPARNAAAVLAAKAQHFRFAAKVWKKNHRFIPTHDNNCWFVIDLFDFFEEYRPLGPGERALRHDAREALALSVKQKAAFWKQRGKFWAIKEGDENTKFFHMRASHCLRKNSIRSLTVDGVDLYAGTVQENGSALAAPFDRKEIKAAVWGMDRPSAPGPDGLGPSFFRAAWEHVAPDLERLFMDFHAGVADLGCINRAHVAMLSKGDGVLAPSSYCLTCRSRFRTAR
jgi:hypothetical protein